MIDPFKLLPILIQALKWSIGPFMVMRVIESFYQGLVDAYPNLVLALIVMSVGLYLVLRDLHALGRHLMARRSSRQ